MKPSYSALITVAALTLSLVYCAVISCAKAGESQMISAEHDVNIDGNVTLNQFIQTLTEAQVAEIVKRVTQNRSSAQDKLFADFAYASGASTAAIENFFRILGKEKVPNDQLLPTLAVIAEQYNAQVERLAALNPQDPKTKSLFRAASAAVYAGRLSDADELLRQIEEVEIAASLTDRKIAKEANDAANRRLLNAAAARGERGAVELQRLEYSAAYTHFKKAKEIAEQISSDAGFSFALRAADVLAAKGDRNGDNDSLQEAIACYRVILSVHYISITAFQLSEVDNNLGQALTTLGSRHSDEAMLSEGESYLRSALQKRSQGHISKEWITTKYNLGTTLEIIGKREIDNAHLMEAISLLESALIDVSREKDAETWSMIEGNLASAYEALGEREVGSANLTKAIEAYKAELEIETRERHPLDWVGTKSNVGATLLALADRTDDNSLREEAVAIFREVTPVVMPGDSPLLWALAQNNLGAALLALGQARRDLGLMQAAAQAFRQAMTEWKPERTPLEWAVAESNLGKALLALGKHKRSINSIQEGIKEFRRALDVQNLTEVPMSWAKTKSNLAEARCVIGELTERWTDIDAALGDYRFLFSNWGVDTRPFERGRAEATFRYCLVDRRNYQRGF